MNQSIKAAVQQRQNRVYSREEVGDERSRFRAEWARLIRDESKRYVNPSFRVMPSDAEHCQAIQRISDSLSARFGECLVNGRLRFGTSQKALNLYLKFVWRLGIAVAPPHCPVDGIVLSAAGIEGSWTRCDTEREYMDWIIWIRKKARPLSLAEWEHQVWLRVAPSQCPDNCWFLRNFDVQYIPPFVINRLVRRLAEPPNPKKPANFVKKQPGFGTAKAVITSGAAAVHASTLSAILSQEPMARA